MPLPFNRTFLLRIAAKAERSCKSTQGLSRDGFVEAARQLGEAQGYVDAKIPTLSDVDRIMDFLVTRSMAQISDAGHWRLTERAREILLEMSDEHTEDIDSLEAYLNDQR